MQGQAQGDVMGKNFGVPPELIRVKVGFSPRNNLGKSGGSP